MSIDNLIEYSPNILKQEEVYFKDEATNFNNDIENTDDFKSFKYNAKLLEKSCRWSEWNFKKCSNCCAIKYLSHFSRSLEM